MVSAADWNVDLSPIATIAGQRTVAIGRQPTHDASSNTCKLPAFIMIKLNLLPIVLFVVLLVAGPPRLSAQQRQQTSQPAKALPMVSAVVATPPDLPVIGKWMIDRSGTTAHQGDARVQV